MTALHLFWVLSALGAAAFVASGYLLRAAHKHADAGRARRLAAELDAKEVERRGAAADADGLRARLAENAAALADAREAERERRRELARAESTAAELEAERQLREETERAHLETRARLDAACGDLGEARRFLVQERSQRGRLEQDAAAVKAALRTLEGERAKYVLRVDIAEARLRAAQGVSEEAERLRREMARLRSELTEASANIGAPGRAEGSAEVLDVRGEALTDPRSRGQREIAALHARLEAAEAEGERLRAELSAVASRAAEGDRAQAEIAQVRAGYASLGDELAAARARVDEATVLVEAAEARAAAAEVRADDAMRRMASSEAELRTSRSRAKVAEARGTENERLRLECQALREEQKERGDLERQLAAMQSEARDLRMRLQAADPKLEELARTTEENRSLRAQVAELEEQEELAATLERVSGEHKAARLQCELMSRRIEELESERPEVFELRTKVQELSAVAAEVSELKRREAALEAQLFSVRRGPESAIIAAVTSDPLDENWTDEDDVESSLRAFVGADGVASVALADRQGLSVGGAGDPRYEEGLAAFAGLADEFATRARTLLPLGNVVWVCLQDASDVEASCRFFAARGGDYGLAAITQGELGRRRSDLATAQLLRVLVDARAGVKGTGTG